MTTTTAKPHTPNRTRRRMAFTAPVKTTPAKKVAVPEEKLQVLSQLVQTVHEEHLAANAATRVYNKDRKILLESMQAEELDSLTVGHLQAVVSAPISEAIDVRKLAGLVTTEQFLEIVSATKEAVTRVVGTAIMAQITVPVLGKENVTVKPLG